MGIGFCNIINMFNPDLVIIGGRIPLNYPQYYEIIINVEKRRLNRFIQENVRIDMPTFNEDEYIIGASALLVHELLNLSTESNKEEVGISV